MRRVIIAMLALSLAAHWTSAAQQRRLPHLGYAYPAGGQRGTSVQVVLGGQFLWGANALHVTGGGIKAEVVRHYPPRKMFLSREERLELIRRLQELVRKRLDELAAKGTPVTVPPWLYGGILRRAEPQQGEKTQSEPVELPPDPLLENLEEKSLRELLYVAKEFLDWGTLLKRQRNAQIGERVVVRLDIAPNAEPGLREVRLLTPLGISNPVLFEVGGLPEAFEREPDDLLRFNFLPPEPPFDTPVVVSGFIEPGDTDRIRFRAKAGQDLVIRVEARRLVPFLADAVPGWCQAVLTLRDTNGRELAYADDWRFDPDPVLFFRAPKDGTYELELHDAIYRGRDDFVYRVKIGELPFVTSVLPLGTHAGRDAALAVEGFHLGTDTLNVPAPLSAHSILSTFVARGGVLSNEVRYQVGRLPEVNEQEDNDSLDRAQPLNMPAVVNGRIGEPGDTDVFRIEGKAGQSIVVEVTARRLLSPLDSLVRLSDASGQVIAWNDDHMIVDGHLHPDMGCLTHHADSYLMVQLPADGDYYVSISDVQRHGGSEYAYRLRLSKPQPDFDLFVCPSSITIPPTNTVPLEAYVIRRDGFEGPVEVALTRAPEGARLDGNLIPAGRNGVTMTLTLPPVPLPATFEVAFQGRAQVNGRLLTRPARPADEVMQAFLWRHLVLAQTAVATVRRGRRGARGVMATPQPERLELAPGACATVLMRTGVALPLAGVQVEPLEPPPGITVTNVRMVPEGLAFDVQADAQKAEPGQQGNLVVQISAVVELPRRDQDGKPRRRRMVLGALPAVPLSIAEPQ